MGKMTTLRFLISIAFAAVLGVLFHARESNAQDQAPPVVVGVVDYNEILDKSKAGKSLRAAVKKQGDSFRAEFEKQEKVFQSKADALRAEQASLSEAEFKKKMESIQSDIQAANEKFREKQKKIEDSHNKALQQIREVLDQIVLGIATEQNISVVLFKSSVAMSDKRYEITEVALKQLDAKLPSVKLQ